MKTNPFPTELPMVSCFGNWCLTLLWRTLMSFDGVWTGDIYVTEAEIVNLCNVVNGEIFRQDHPSDVLSAVKRATLADQIWLIVKDKLKANPTQLGDWDHRLPNPIGKTSEQLQRRVNGGRPPYSHLAYCLYQKVYGEGWAQGLSTAVTDAVASRIHQALTTHHGVFTIGAFSDVVLFIRKMIAEQGRGGKATLRFFAQVGDVATTCATLEDIDAAGDRARRIQGRAPTARHRRQLTGLRGVAPPKRRRHDGA